MNWLPRRCKALLSLTGTGLIATPAIYRNALIATLSLSYLAIFASTIVFGWLETWRTLGLPSMSPAFADMRSVQGALASHSEGLNPQIENPGDPWGRAMNYPSIWLNLAQALNLSEETNYLVFVISFLVGAFCCILLLLRSSPSIWILCFALSGSTLLAFERGNNDLLVFALLYLAAYCKIFWAASLVSLATALKVYPILAGVIFFKSSSSLLLFALVVSPAALLIAPELSSILSGTPQFADLSYGSPAVSLLLERSGIELAPEFISLGLVLSAFLVFTLRRKNALSKPDAPTESQVNLFMMGSGIYIGTFILSSNFDYRLIFVMMCFPYFLKTREAMGFAVMLFAIISANSLFMRQFLGTISIYITALSKAALFILLLAYLIEISYRELSRACDRKPLGRLS